MKITLLTNTPLNIVSTAIRTCWDSHAKSDTVEEVLDLVELSPEGEYNKEYCTTQVTCGPDDKALINRIGNKMKHESVKNHCSYTFQIEGITTKTLLALTRHDVGVEFSVQSTRYTTAKSVKNGSAGYTESKSDMVNTYLADIHTMIKKCVDANVANDEISMLLPQAWNYNLVCTMSMTALQHFLKLRLKPDSHWNIQELAQHLYDSIPSEHKYLFEDSLYKEQ